MSKSRLPPLDSAAKKTPADSQNKMQFPTGTKYTVERRLGPSTFLVSPSSIEIRKVIKVIPKAPDLNTEDLQGHIEKYKEATDHASLLAFDVEFTQDMILIITEYCEGGSLQALIMRAKSQDEMLNDIEVMDWFVEILLGLEHLSDMCIVHRQLSSNNILLKNNEVRIMLPKGVFELFAPTAQEQSFPQCISTAEMHYAAPEVVEDGQYSFMSDIWAVGCILYEMCSRRKLFSGTREEVISKVKNHREVAGKFDNEILQSTEIFKKMLAPEVINRPSSQEILQHPVISEHLEEMASTIEPSEMGAMASVTASGLKNPFVGDDEPYEEPDGEFPHFKN